ncbi:MAG: hypothetical protein JW839_03145 [Candidatus Lokiarchaeota archaeon]|nr:hypothetical protein [Candidatus Lokiarchaeota archaeon]
MVRGIAAKTAKIVKKDSGEEVLLLDTPTEYLCGPWFGFYAAGGFHLFKNCDREYPYTLMNLKAGNMVNRLTVEFHKTLPAGAKADDGAGVEVKAQFFADVYYTKTELNCIFFYSVKNTCQIPFTDLRLFHLFDFDIGGLAGYDGDEAYFDKEHQAIVQYDGSVHVGFCSTGAFPVAHYAAGHPYELKIDARHPSLDDVILAGPDDLFSGLEWNLGTLNPGEFRIIPVVIAAGESREEFYDNLRKGIGRARGILPELPRIISLPERQQRIADGVIKQMNEKASKGGVRKDEC